MSEIIFESEAGNYVYKYICGLSVAKASSSVPGLRLKLVDHCGVSQEG